jgi:hypothetical protein
VCVNPWMLARLKMRARGYALSVYSNNNTVFEHGQKEEEEETHGGSVCGCCVRLCNKTLHDVRQLQQCSKWALCLTLVTLGGSNCSGSGMPRSTPNHTAAAPTPP